MNLLQKNTLEKLFPGKDHEEMLSTLNIFHELSVNTSFFNIITPGHISIQGASFSDNIPIENIIKVATKLNTLKSYKNFDSFSEGFKNPTQFSDTIFEVDCAHFSLKSFKTKNIEFEPEVIKNGKVKRPDFLLILFDSTEIICECKSLSSLNRAKGSKALKLMEQLEPELHETLDFKYRVEISFKSLPGHWNRNYSNQLHGAVKTLIKYRTIDETISLNFIDANHSTLIRLSKIDEPLFFKELINVGNQPKTNKPTLVISEQNNIKKDIKNSIRDARTQIPETENSIIFLYSLNEFNSEQGINEFYRDNQPENLLATVSWTTKAKVHKNPHCKVNIDDFLI